MNTPRFSISAGTPDILGASYDGQGVNFALYSADASRVIVCLYADDRQTPLQALELPECTGGIWHGYIEGLKPGQHYLYRVDGPYQPELGLRFNVHKALLDPYARQLTGHPICHDALFAYQYGHVDEDLSFDTQDSAPYMPRCVVAEPSILGRPDTAQKPLTDSVIYEAHVKGMTAGRRDLATAGTFAGLASEPVLTHLNKLGVTAIELLPVQAFLNDRFLFEKSLTNYWGYQSIGFFAPEPRYLSATNIYEFQAMVGRFHSAGIEVILDVVYNHTGEGNQLGPSLSFRGIDNRTYYRLPDNLRHYINDTGTGNTLNANHPMVLRLILDSLRYWVEVMHVDGFRFDLCATLGRTEQGFSAHSAFFSAIRQDPVLSRVKLIAEPWDIGPGGYQLGAFPAPFAEWNDQFRDGVRSYWHAGKGLVPDLAQRLTGSALQFGHSARAASSSVNFICAHDGFTLHDVVSYQHKHNLANGEDNRDGHDHNCSDNHGVEGHTDDAQIIAARAQTRRNLMATLLLSQGTPMLLAGDELGHTQQGNNNAYCQDNAITWIDWSNIDQPFLAFTQKLIALRRANPVLRQKRFLHSSIKAISQEKDLLWLRADAQVMQEQDWQNHDNHLLCVQISMAASTPAYEDAPSVLYMVFNAGDALEVCLPERAQGWHCELDSASLTGVPDRAFASGQVQVAAQSLQVWQPKLPGAHAGSHGR